MEAEEKNSAVHSGIPKVFSPVCRVVAARAHCRRACVCARRRRRSSPTVATTTTTTTTPESGGTRWERGIVMSEMKKQSCVYVCARQSCRQAMRSAVGCRRGFVWRLSSKAQGGRPRCSGRTINPAGITLCVLCCTRPLSGPPGGAEVGGTPPG